MNLKTGLVALALCALAPAAFAQKPVARSPLEVGEDVVEVTEQAPDGRYVSAADGTPRVLAGVDHAVAPGVPEAMAREYLAAQTATFRMAAPTLDDLTHVRTRSGRSGHTVRFQQTLGGIPVHGAETVVNIDPRDRVQAVINGYRADLAVPSLTPTLAAAAARQAVLGHLAATGAFQFDETDLVVYPAADGAHLAWLVRLVPEAPYGDWEAFVDAQTGTLLRVADRTLYHRGDHGHEGGDPPAIPTIEAERALLMTVDGTGVTFVADPLSRAHVAYGAPGYVEGTGSTGTCISDPNQNPACDLDTPQLTAARVPIVLQGLTFDGTNYTLVGPWAEIREYEAPNRGLFAQPGTDFSFTRNAAAFEGVMTYYHIDQYMRYLNDTLGVAVRPDQYPGGVRFDAHGLGGQDNSNYMGASGRLAFGEGGVDDNEDADVIIHELGHGLHDWLAGAVSNGDGLSEGLGDYFAASYSRSLNQWQPGDAAYHWVYSWDGHNPFWPGRVTNFAGTYPSGSAPHARGQHWATACMRIVDDIGRERTDLAVAEGINMTGGSTTQPQAAQMVLQAAANMGYTLAEVQAMHARFVAKGYNVTIPTNVAAESGPEVPADFELTAAYPNPFNPQARFTLRVAAPQQVRVALYDALGREVRVLYEGTLAAGTAHAFALDAAGLPSGLYVYRATGETFSASRTAMLVK